MVISLHSKELQLIRLGIDTGGTFTDAVVVDVDSVQVLAHAKALTTKENLTLGIGNAIDALPRDVLMLAEHAALSTTLATNACVEGKGGRAKLVLVGATDELLHRVDAQGKFGIPYADVITLPFVGSYDGNDVEIPDWDALYEANPGFFEEADSFGIASLYALNNGSVVEKSGAAWLREKFGKLVVESTEIAVEPNVIGRGATALLNARLVPVIDEFLNAVNAAFADRGLVMPLAIVRSDGTLMSEELARLRPVETILSGPAASVTGARALAGCPESLIVDIGGTTSDISVVHAGRANRTDGIVIGGWKTQVAGVQIDTIALGGDTQVRFAKNSKLELGTRRVMPLCIAAQRWPQVIRALERYLVLPGIDFHARYELLYLLRDPGDVTRFNQTEQQLIDLLRDGPVAFHDDRMYILGLKPDRLEDEGIVMRCGMTPTDAMHIKGDFCEFDARASRLGAQCLLKSYRGADAAADDAAIAAVADEIYDLAQYRLFSQVLGMFAQDRFWPEGQTAFDAQMSAIVERVWADRAAEGRPPFSVRFESDAALVGVGAPTHVFLPAVADMLSAPCVVPQHAPVANAVGAAVSRISVEQRVYVNPVRGADGVVQGYKVRGSGSAEMCDHLDEALEVARERAGTLAQEEARRRGASGELACNIEEHRRVFRATAIFEVDREWTVVARIGFDE